MFCTKCGEKSKNDFIICGSCLATLGLNTNVSERVQKQRREVTVGMGLVFSMAVVGLIFYSVYIFSAWDMIDSVRWSSWNWDRWESNISPVALGWIRMVLSVGSVLFCITCITQLKIVKSAKYLIFGLGFFLLLEIFFRVLYHRLEVDVIFLFIYYLVFFFGLGLQYRKHKNTE